jgi:small subunit ribosomal protein S20
LPNKKSAIKRVQIAERNRKRNTAFKSSARTAIKKAAAVASVAEATPETIAEAFRKAQSLLDRAVLKGILSKNKAARDKARLHKRLVTVQAAKA